MASDRDRLDKVLAIAVNPGAYETEAVAALRAALAHPPLHPRPKAAPLGEHSRQVRITNVAPFWLYIVINSLSQQAYGLGLKRKIVIDFKVTPYALDVRCDGAETACDAFARYGYEQVSPIVLRGPLSIAP
jgi:hypothetical protein